MKSKKLILAVLISAVLPFFTSCDKQGDSSSQYPSHLEGVWTYVNASTGYTGILVIKDIDGGQYAYFSLVSPTGKQENIASGSFTYDASTGKGNISSGLVGGTTSVIAYLSTDSKVDVAVSTLVSGGSKVTFQETFEKVGSINLPTGQWAGTKVVDKVKYTIQLEITSIEPKSGSYGTLSIAQESGTEKKTGIISYISSFAQIDEDNALGIIVARENDTSLELPFAVVYDPTDKDMTLTNIFDLETSIELESVNVN